MILDDLQEKYDAENASSKLNRLQTTLDSEKVGGEAFSRFKDILHKTYYPAETFLMGKHHTLYGLYGIAAGIAESFGKVGHAKYGDPYEVKKLAKMSPKEQRKQLLWDTLENVTMIAFGALRAPKAKMPKITAKTGEARLAEVFAARQPKPISQLTNKQYIAKREAWVNQRVQKGDINVLAAYKEFAAKYGSPPWKTVTKPAIISIKDWTPKTPQNTMIKEFPEHGLRYEGMLEGLPQFTPQKGKMFKRTFNFAEGEKPTLKGLRTKIKEISTGDWAEPMLTSEQIAAIGRGEEITVGKPHKELFDKITAALKEAKPIRRKQEALYSQERAKRLKAAIAAGKKMPGEKGYFAQLHELKGKLPKAEFESLRGKIGQEDIDTLFDIIDKSIDVTGFHNITAKQGLSKLFGEQGGRVPTEGELALLRKIFPANLIQALLKKRTTFQKLTEAGLQLANIPRAVMASYDLSAPFRQGIFLIGHPKRFMQSFVKMFKQFGSEKAFLAVQESTMQKSTYNLMKESGLALTERGAGLALREEAFMAPWGEKIPILIGRGVKASGRAHMGFLNKLRADVFEDLVLKAEKLGLDPRNNMDLTKEIARFVNAASGRGGLGSLERSAVTLNTFFFSPRLMSSRLTLLNPVYYIKAHPFVRKEALKSLFVTAGAMGTVLGLAKAGGLQVGTDVRSADFAKIKIEKTRIDVGGGFQQYIRAAGQLISGQYVSSTTGKVMTLGEGYRPLTRLEILYRQIEAKEAPIFSFATQMLKGRDIKGEKLNIPKEVGDRFIPMVLRDVYDIAQEDPTLLPITALGFFGVGLQTYGETPKIPGGIEASGGIEGLGLAGQ